MNTLLALIGALAIWFIWASLFGKDISKEQRDVASSKKQQAPTYNPKSFGFRPARGYPESTLKFMEERNGELPDPTEFPPAPTYPPTNKITKFSLTAEMKRALADIENGKNIFIQGFAGTGKSTFIRYVEKELTDKGHAVAITAPTGIAAQNINGSTLHSFFRLFPSDEFLTYEELRKKRKIEEYDISLFQHTDLIIIDEISMTRADIFDYIGETLKRHAQGCQICVIGDLKQLPPVIDSKIPKAIFSGQVYDSPYFTSSKYYAELDFQKHYFTHNFRQDEKEFMDVLGKVRNNAADKPILDYFNQRIISKTGEPKHPLITLCTTKDVANKINNEKLKVLTRTRTLWKYDAKYSWNDLYGSTPAKKEKNLHEKLKKQTRPEQRLKLALGARVMFTTNASGWVNGTMGTVEELNEQTVKVRVDNREIVTVHRYEYEIHTYSYDEKSKRVKKKSTTYHQFPLMLAWAVTIHKAQGLSLKSVRINLHDGTFAKEQFYVAVSRCHAYDGLYFDSEITAEDIQGQSLHIKRQNLQ